MAHTKASARSPILLALSGSILLAISVSTLKLWEACLLTIGASLAAYTVPSLFFLFAALAHFSEKMLSVKARHATLACTYSCKLVTSVTLALHEHADLICQTAREYGEVVRCTGGAESGQFSGALVALGVHHPIQVTIPILATLLFLVLGDILALALEFLHASVEEFAVAQRARR